MRPLLSSVEKLRNYISIQHSAFRIYDGSDLAIRKDRGSAPDEGRFELN